MRPAVPWLLFALLFPCIANAAVPDMSLSFAFEPRIGTYAALDSKLRDYRYAPVGSPFLTAFGLRGRVFHQGARHEPRGHHLVDGSGRCDGSVCA